ncbi:Flp pilus assembly complex ATPase component TadA [bacterium]|nr:Flp pilus assembly complex ATPase component TadA [bacterium]
MIRAQNKITKYLLEKGKISNERYAELEKEAKKLGIGIDTLLERKNFVSEEEIAKAKSEIFSIPYTDLYGITVDRTLLKILPKEISETYQMVAFGKEGNDLKVALTDPSNFKAQEAVEFIAHSNNLGVKYFVSTPSAIKNVLAQYSGLAAEVEEALGVAEKKFAPLIRPGRVWEETEKLEKVSKVAPITKLVSSILKYAVDNSASDVHIEPFGDKTRVRYRIDGILRTRAVLPGYLHPAIISRIKVMANLKLDETRIPQDGRIKMMISGRKIDMRVATFPLLGKEKVVLRILDPTKRIFDLESLGFSGKGLDSIKKNLSRPHGMILATGPTGCGKTTTLYAALKILNKEGVNIVTLEDPIEYSIDGVNQSQVKPEIGYTFASGIRSIVRQDPNVIMVGEIRDNETAELAVHAALTGHIVLSTLHTNDAFGAIPRLIDMKIEPFLIASTLNLVIAQRLVRKICPHCKEETEINEPLEKEIEENLKDIPNFDLEKYRDKKTGRLKFYHGKGCSHCNYEGYKGRTAIFETLEITEQMKKIIVSGCKIDDVKKEFKRQGMIEMIKNGYIKALNGETTIEEVLRVARE